MSHHDGKKRADDAPQGEKLKGKEYESELKKLHVELVKLQEWVKHKGLKICVVFEGRDGAGKGGTIKAITGQFYLGVIVAGLVSMIVTYKSREYPT